MRRIFYGWLIMLCMVANSFALDPLLPVPTTNLDSSTDSPALARGDLFELTTRFNRWDRVPCSAYASLTAAVTAIGSAHRTLVVNSSVATTGATVIPATLTVEAESPGLITSNYALTINGPFHVSGLRQVFSGTGTVTFGSGSVALVYPNWWAVNSTPGTTDMTIAVQAAVTAVQGTSMKLSLPSWYKVTTAVNITKYISIHGTGKNSGIVNATATGSAAFIVDGSGSAWPYANYSKFADFSIVGDASTSGSGIKYNDRAAFLQFDRVYLEGNNHGIWHYAPPNSGGTARATWGSSYGATFNSVYSKANYGNGFYDDSTDNPDPGAQFISCISEQNAVGIDWGSGEVSLVGGVYQADVGGEVIFRARASLVNAYFEAGVADYSGNAIVSLYGYGSSIQGCTFNSNATANIKHISYRSTTIIDGNVLGASGSPVGCIGIYNASSGQAYTASKIFNNINNGTTTFQSLGTAELFYQDSAGATHLASVITSGSIAAGASITMNGTLTNGTPGTNNTNTIRLGYASAASVKNFSLFIDSSTGKLSYKNAGTGPELTDGSVFALY